MTSQHRVYIMMLGKIIHEPLGQGQQASTEGGFKQM